MCWHCCPFVHCHLVEIERRGGPLLTAKSTIPRYLNRWYPHLIQHYSVAAVNSFYSIGPRGAEAVVRKRRVKRDSTFFLRRIERRRRWRRRRRGRRGRGLFYDDRRRLLGLRLPPTTLCDHFERSTQTEHYLNERTDGDSKSVLAFIDLFLFTLSFHPMMVVVTRFEPTTLK